MYTNSPTTTGGKASPVLMRAAPQVRARGPQSATAVPIGTPTTKPNTAASVDTRRERRRVRQV